VLDRFAALAVISTEWLGMLKIPESLRYFGDSSRVEISGMVAAVLRESSHPDAVRTRLFAGGAADSSDLAASSLRLIAYRLAALSRPIEIVIENSLFERLSEANRFALSSLADHPWISIGLATALPRATGASVLAEVSHGLSGVAWASAGGESVVPNEEWGASRAPLVIGTLSGGTGTVSNRLESAEIRPQVLAAGDREIVLHHQVDGPLQGFGKRLWQVIADEHHGTLQQVQNSGEDVVAITYSDRYLFTPLSVALLVDLVSRLKEIVGQARWDDPELTITTTAVRSSGESRVFNRVFADWPDLSVRNAVARGAFEYLGIRTTVLVPNKFSVQHGRVLEVRFSDGKTLSVRLDQGVSYWRVPVLSGARQPPVGFDFTKSANDQIRDVVEMRVAVEGGALPTELFVKLR
jgi:DEAD/DEAH box helicase domain-containing protein